MGDVRRAAARPYLGPPVRFGRSAAAGSPEIDQRRKHHMKLDSPHSATWMTMLFTFILVANLAPLMTVPTVLPSITTHLHLTAGQAGWIGGIYFAGYALAAPLLASAVDRGDGRRVLAASSLLGGISCLLFAVCATGFWTALSLRFASGVAISGVHMPGLKMLADRTARKSQIRSAAIYTSSYALGNAGSSLLAGVVSAAFAWRAPFIAGGIGALLALPAVYLVPSTHPHQPATRRNAPVRLEQLLRNRHLVAYILGFAGNTWEVFAIRVWFVAYLTWMLRLPGNRIPLPNLGVVAGLAALLGVPASVLVAELAVRYRRSTVIVVTCAVSVSVCLALAMTVGDNIYVVLSLLILLNVTSFADVGALSGGAIAATDPAERGKAFGYYAMIGFASGFVGPVAVGMVLDQFGGLASPAAWPVAFIVMALGSVAAGCAVWHGRSLDPPRRVAVGVSAE